MLSKKINPVIRFFRYLWSLFLTGLLTILPITITIALVNISFRVITGWLLPLRQFAPPFLVKVIPYTEIILAIIIIFLIGTLYNIFILRPLIHAVEGLIFKIPLIRPVYSGIKQLVQAFGAQDKLTFKKVVLVEFPRSGIYSLGFLTSELPPDLAPETTEKHFNIYIPTTPNPTSGYLVIFPENQITIIDLTRQEAITMIISGGIIQPDRFNKI